MTTSHRRIRRLTALTCLALTGLALAAALPAAALAHRNAGSAQRRAILAAAVSAHRLASGQAACSAVTVSTINRDWALISGPEHPSRACARVEGNGAIVEHLVATHWHVAFTGSELACTAGGMPAAVGRDLLGRACGSF